MHLSPGLVVVQIHQAPGIAGVRFLGVQKFPGKSHAEAQVHAASAPLPGVGRRAGVQGAGVVRVAAADGYVAPAACVHQCVRHAGADHGVHISRFSAGCEHKRKNDLFS